MTYIERRKDQWGDTMAQLRSRIEAFRDLDEMARSGPLFDTPIIREILAAEKIQPDAGALRYLKELANAPDEGAFISNAVKKYLYIIRTY